MINAISYQRTGPIEKGRWQFLVELDGEEAFTTWAERNDWPCLEKWFRDAYGWAVSLLCFGKMEA
jgi:hypothetical protein